MKHLRLLVLVSLLPFGMVAADQSTYPNQAPWQHLRDIDFSVSAVAENAQLELPQTLLEEADLIRSECHKTGYPGNFVQSRKSVSLVDDKITYRFSARCHFYNYVANDQWQPDSDVRINVGDQIKCWWNNFGQKELTHKLRVAQIAQGGPVLTDRPDPAFPWNSVWKKSDIWRERGNCSVFNRVESVPGIAMGRESACRLNPYVSGGYRFGEPRYSYEFYFFEPAEIWLNQEDQSIEVLYKELRQKWQGEKSGYRQFTNEGCFIVDSDRNERQVELLGKYFKCSDPEYGRLLERPAQLVSFIEGDRALLRSSIESQGVVLFSSCQPVEELEEN